MSILAIAIAGFWFWWGRSQPTTDLHLQTTIRTEPSGALVILGDHAEKSPATFDDLEPRKYRLRVMSPGYEPIEATIDLAASRSPQLPEFHLVRSKGEIDLQSEPAGAQVSLRS